jgi:uncharacterized Zn finger protein (UPF0148 family)
MENCQICDNKLAEINGEIKCSNCGYLQDREEQDMPTAIKDDRNKK